MEQKLSGEHDACRGDTRLLCVQHFCWEPKTLSLNLWDLTRSCSLAVLVCWQNLCCIHVRSFLIQAVLHLVMGPVMCGQTVALISLRSTTLCGRAITCHTSFIYCKNIPWLFPATPFKSDHIHTHTPTHTTYAVQAPSIIYIHHTPLARRNFLENPLESVEEIKPPNKPGYIYGFN